MKHACPGFGDYVFVSVQSPKFTCAVSYPTDCIQYPFSSIPFIQIAICLKRDRVFVSIDSCLLYMLQNLPPLCFERGRTLVLVYCTVTVI